MRRFANEARKRGGKMKKSRQGGLQGQAKRRDEVQRCIEPMEASEKELRRGIGELADP